MSAADRDRSQRFLAAFRRIEKSLERHARDRQFNDFGALIHRAAATDSTVRQMRAELGQFARLRNAIVHESGREAIAEPHAEVCNRIEQIADLLEKPPLVLPTFGRTVQTFRRSDPIAEVARAAFRNDFSQFPILDGGRICGLLIGNTVFRWLGALADEDLFSVSETTIGDVLGYQEEAIVYRIVKRASTQADVLRLFEERAENGPPLHAVLITHDGKDSSALLGIISAWDVPRIHASLWGPV